MHVCALLRRPPLPTFGTSRTVEIVHCGMVCPQKLRAMPKPAVS